MRDFSFMDQIPFQKKRLEFIDLLRGWAVIVMIETHVMNATLTPDILKGDVFQVLKFINGLVAPSFLFASGLAYAITTRRKIADYLNFGTPLFQQLGRLLLILLVGYTLHIPKFNYYHLRYIAGERAWQVFFQADVLHCIAISLLFLQILLLLARNEGRMYRVLTVVAVVVVLATPIMWGIDFWNVFPVPIAAYMNGMHDSIFPLFPWSAFLFAGAITGWFYLRAKERETAGSPDAIVRMMRYTAWLGLGAILFSFMLDPLARQLYPTYNYWKSSPSFFLLRLGIVQSLCTLMFVYERRRGLLPRSPVTLVGRESLIVYTAHLLLVYGDFGAFNFQKQVGQTFGYPLAILTVVTLWGLMYVLALVWSMVKQKPARVKRGVQFAFLAILACFFFFGPNL
jgi:uncharacterized membrane protein